ncbi:hypothetical protein [Ancylobacter amanitiformis]|uniref:Uncharacterized protein n=1 Tax=Ancylobacter amanitiformis TaxID=217069 RepID=A0ABU0LQ80_9HYPH|nr:hypothetical protein [Ancylobacter amanitiformis]MDQ0510861.1 hypothetical protein [Ancylobacter amanitiformis]
MQPAEGPAPGYAAAVGSVSKQAAIAGHDRRELAVCRARLDGLQEFVRTERAVLEQIRGGALER